MAPAVALFGASLTVKEFAVSDAEADVAEVAPPRVLAGVKITDFGVVP